MNNTQNIILDKEEIIDNCMKKMKHLPISDKLLTKMCVFHKCIILSTNDNSTIKSKECLEEFHSFESRFSIDKTFKLNE